MPYLNITTNAPVSKKQKDTIERAISKVILLIPKEKEELLMVNYEDCSSLSLSGDFSTPAAMVELRVFPIIAYVERYQALIGRLDRIEELKGLGIYLQVNADSIEGGFFDDKTRWVRKLIIGGYIEFVSTDCHDTDSRSPSINKAAEWVRKKWGLDVAEALFGVNADIIIKNKYIEIAN